MTCLCFDPWDPPTHRAQRSNMRAFLGGLPGSLEDHPVGRRLRSKTHGFP